MDPLLTKLEELGYEIVPVSQLIYKENYHINSSGIQVANETPLPEESTADSTDSQSAS